MCCSEVLIHRISVYNKEFRLAYLCCVPDAAGKQKPEVVHVSFRKTFALHNGNFFSLDKVSSVVA